MRADQFQRMLVLQEQLTEVYLMEADPKHLPGHDKHVTEWSRDERGDRYWHKRNAAATMSLVARIGSLIDSERRAAQTLPPEEQQAESDDVVDDLDRELSSYEKKAKAAAKKLLERASHR